MSDGQSYDDEQTLLVRRAVFGKQVEAFMNTEVGQYILSRADDKRNEALQGLKTCDPEDSKIVRKYQNSARLAEDIVQWLQDAVSDGLQAIEIIDNRE